jgi:hypothetical protein
MKIINRMALGTLSSILLCAGFARAAQKLDPLSNSITDKDFNAGSNGAASPCVFPCLYLPE